MNAMHIRKHCLCPPEAGSRNRLHFAGDGPRRAAVVAVTNGRLDFCTWERIFQGQAEWLPRGILTAGGGSACWSGLSRSRGAQSYLGSHGAWHTMPQSPIHGAAWLLVNLLPWIPKRSTLDSARPSFARQSPRLWIVWLLCAIRILIRWAAVRISHDKNSIHLRRYPWRDRWSARLLW